jgi:hypothetical protein
LSRFARKAPKKIAFRAIFYPANSVEPEVRCTPDNRDFCVTGGAKIHLRQAARTDPAAVYFTFFG